MWRHVCKTAYKTTSETDEGVNRTVSVVLGMQYLVSWLEVEIQTPPVDEGCGMDFFRLLYEQLVVHSPFFALAAHSMSYSPPR
jgi:hypothetical protein